VIRRVRPPPSPQIQRVWGHIVTPIFGNLVALVSRPVWHRAAVRRRVQIFWHEVEDDRFLFFGNIRSAHTTNIIASGI
jgi:hypothetical protein